MKVCKKDGGVSAKERQLVTNYIFAFRRYGLRTLYDCYANPSCYKIRAWRDISDAYYDANGKGLSVIAHNCQSFSCAYICDMWEDGKKMHVLKYYTKDYFYKVELRDELLEYVISAGLGYLL